MLRLAPWLPLLALPGQAQGHAFGQLYTLPVPFWLYAWGAMAALLLSFLVVAWFVVRPAAPAGSTAVREPPAWLKAAVVRLHLPGLLRAGALLALLLCIVSGLFGTQQPYHNLGMTLFWIGFVLAFAYLSILVGNLYHCINPWQQIVRGLQRLGAGAFQGRLRYPPALGSWPALAFYLLFIWLELFGGLSPRGLAVALLAYTGINVAGAWLLGAPAWFRHCELFAVLLRLMGSMAPIGYRDAAAGEGSGWYLRWPLVGLLQRSSPHLSEVVFILFMLSSTAFDGLHATEVWHRLFWEELRGWLVPLTGSGIVEAYPVLKPLYGVFNAAALLLSPFIYLAVFVAFLAAARALVGSGPPLRQLLLQFAPSLLPIAIVYHLTHYYTLVLTQGRQLLRLVSDPLGRGWDLFGTAGSMRSPYIPDMDWVWHTQVGLILLGHIIAVYAAHVIALRIWPRRAEAALSQLPMLLLMMAFTASGLWVLSQPLQATLLP